MEFGLIVAGISGGILGGMGMGGGTLTIPLLRIFFGVDQHIAQAANLISFIPMAAVTLVIHFKNRLIEKKGVLTIILAGLLSCASGAYLASLTPSDVLKKVFGGFLLLLSVIQFVSVLRAKK